MLARTRIASLLAPIFLLVATAAFAVTEQELLIRADVLDAARDAWLTDAQTAQPEDYAALVAEHDDLEADRLDLEADRETLQGCGCTQLDGLIAEIGTAATGADEIIDQWGL